MKKTAIRLLIFLAFVVNFKSNELSAQDSSRLRISLLTCTPGDELYSIFGHSAIRITDSSNVGNDYFDIVYNYGTFNFDDEGFYLKFMRGKLLYFISIVKFDDFKFDYQSTNRGMTEQVLNLTSREKENIHVALKENLKEENRYYQYDFFLDNCTTRLRDIIEKYKQPRPLFHPVMPANTRFRYAIHQYLDKGKQYWSKLGIDILLGARTDRIMTTSQQQFLPDNLMLAMDKSSPRLSLSSENLYQLTNNTDKKSWLTPALFFSLLLGFFISLSLSKNKYAQSVLNGLDGLLFFTTGFLGFILLFMWFFTDHSMTKNNFNLIWALPTHIFFSFLINNNKPFVKKYFLATAISLVILLLLWPFLPQQMNNSLIPVVLLLLFRSAMKYIK